MAATDYEKYVVREPLAWNVFPPYTPRMYFDSQNHFPEMGFGIRYTYIQEPIEMETPHAHEWDQFFVFLGTPEDQRVFDGEVEVHLGEEQSVLIINSTSVLYVPAGMVHTPFIWKRVSKPMMFINVALTSSYTRSDQKDTFRDRVDVKSTTITLEEAARVLGAPVPRPSVMKPGAAIRSVFAFENRVRLVVSDKDIETRYIKSGDADGTHEEHSFECQYDLDIGWYPDGKPGGLDRAGEKIVINDAITGTLVDKEQHVELWWLQPGAGTGQYELRLATGKKTPRADLINIARSVRA